MPDSDTDIGSLDLATGPLVLVIGSEGKGLSRLVSAALRSDRADPDHRRRVAERERRGRDRAVPDHELRAAATA